MRTVAVVRALYGAVLLVAPDVFVRRVTGEPAGRGVSIVGRLLGARHLGQALTAGRSGSRAWLLVGTLADIAHGLTMVAVALVSSDHRRLAALDALVASAWALTGLWAVERE
ncbi:hypothetical protein [Halococcus agarilyticus]|uniref:hypothetical protein n=1 Tax=Halococcus agarilyticus TaxID=1232219 RepID=UPI000677C695|nr:hypothetical protein [Halococcus agarilyticus]